MKFKSIHVIVNPASGKEEPILSYLNKSFLEAGIDWNVSVTRPNEDVYDLAKGLIGKADLLAIYGGDGSVTQVARALMGSDLPLAIIPGGTANVFSKELGMPQDSLEAIKLITGGAVELAFVDMGTINGHTFMLRINFGILADMVLLANRDLKDKLGQVAYGVTAIEALANVKPVTYHMTIDGKEVVEKGVALTVTNAGNIGMGDFSFLPDISINDGRLDVILMEEANVMSIIKIASSTLLKNDSDVLKHWKCKEFKLHMPQPVKYICDDCEEEAALIEIKVLPLALKVLAPLTYAKPA